MHIQPLTVHVFPLCSDAGLVSSAKQDGGEPHLSVTEVCYITAYSHSLPLVAHKLPVSHTILSPPPPAGGWEAGDSCSELQATEPGAQDCS